MISFSRDNEKVVCTVETDLPYGCADAGVATLPFEFGVVHPYMAEVLSRYLTERMQRQLTAIRREAYQRGWTDAKAKARKRFEFCWVWDETAVGR